MSKAPAPVFRFKEDPIHALILDTLNKKPVNSDYYSLVKRIKLSDYTKRPVSSENIETVGNRVKEYMNEVGFAYGRLQEKNWIEDQVKQGKVRIHATGPVINKLIEEVEDENLDFLDNFHPKIMPKFQKIKPQNISVPPTGNISRNRGKTTRPNTRISASQRQAREYLNYLNALNLNEFSFINSQVAQKTNDLKEKFEIDAVKKEKILNNRGIFTPQFNKQRVLSMLPVKMQSQVKMLIEPMIRNSKEIVMKEKSKEWQSNPFNYSKCETADTIRSERNGKLLNVVERTISKKIVKNKRKEVSLINTKKEKVKLHWIDQLNKTINESMIKCKPDERISNMEVL